MLSYLLAALWAFTAYILYLVIVGIVTARRDAAEAERLGCKPPYKLISKLPLGIDFVQEAMAADKAQRFPNMCMDRHTRCDGKTHQYNVLRTKGVFTSDPKNIQAILATQFHDFGTGAARRRNFLPLLGSGIFTLDGEGWQHSRTMLRPQFAREQVSNLELEEDHVKNIMRAIPVVNNGWTSQIDLQVLFFRLTLDSACEFLFGESPDSQLAALGETSSTSSFTSKLRQGGKPDGNSFGKAFDLGQKYLAMRSRFADMYWLVNDRVFRHSCKDVHHFVDYYVKLALDKDLKEKELEKGQTTLSGAKVRYVFLDALVAETRDPIELRSQLLNILLAGRDTTASLLGWLFYLLARHPDVYAKLRAAVLDDFGPHGKTDKITFATLKNCQYLHYCINETLRMYPVVPVNSRRATRDTSIPRGGGPDGMSKVFIKKGDPVDYSVYVMHRRTDLWGSDANEFNPDRWIGRRPGWEYLPFNGGPRICLGQQFALTESSYVAVRILQRFDAIENLDTEPVPKHNLTLTDCSGTGVKVRLHAANE